MPKIEVIRRVVATPVEKFVVEFTVEEAKGVLQGYYSGKGFASAAWPALEPLYNVFKAALTTED